MLTLVLAGCGGDEGGGAAVEIRTFQFQPDPIEVEAGENVGFVNFDGTTHTVTAGTRSKPDPRTFDAKLAQNGRFEFTFDRPGEYEYFCSLHSGDGMVGKVVVL